MNVFAFMVPEFRLFTCLLPPDGAAHPSDARLLRLGPPSRLAVQAPLLAQ